MRPSFTLIVTGLFLAYIGYFVWMMYGIFFPAPCPPTESCLKPYLARRPRPRLELQVLFSRKNSSITKKDMSFVWKYDNFTVGGIITRTFNLTVPIQTRNNGTLYVHAFLYPRGKNPFLDPCVFHAWSTLTTYSYPQSTYLNLLGARDNQNITISPDKPFTHWRPKLTINVLQDEISFNRHALPLEIYRYIRLSPEGDYLPIVFIDELSNRMGDLQLLNKTSRVMPLTIHYSPISIGKLRLWSSMLESIKFLYGLGFKEKDVDEIKGIFADTNFFFLMLTFTVAAFHLLFDFLAFKNDISFWKGKKTMVGLSSRGVVWRCISTLIVFLYLLDEETSMLVVVPTGVGAAIEVWKVTKAFKIKIKFHGIKPSVQFGTATNKERETEAFDSQAMRYLSYILYPLCTAGAVYSLVYIQHKSWYSWCINSLVNGVYAFGFLFMLPQLFVNYKLKSVAHLPWRAFMYKAFNTFIDDVFAFIISMPTAHRLACFRDDVVFLVYLYQRWLYPVDKARVNEYGMSFDDENKLKKKKQ